MNPPPPKARLVHDRLPKLLPKGQNSVFLDSDDLHDLRLLLEHVKCCGALLLLQSKQVLTRPWVIMELYTALIHQVPIVALNVQNSYPYNYAAASEFLLHFVGVCSPHEDDPDLIPAFRRLLAPARVPYFFFILMHLPTPRQDQDIDIANPGASQLLIDHGVDPLDVAYLLSEALPNIISIDFNPNGSARQIHASLEDLVDAMATATAFAPSVPKDQCLARPDAVAKEQRRSSLPQKAHGKLHRAASGSSTVSARQEEGLPPAPSSLALSSSSSTWQAAILADVPSTVPELPNSYLVRDKDLTGLKDALLDAQGPCSASLTSKSAGQRTASKTTAHGMGGVGKSESITSSFISPGAYGGLPHWSLLLLFFTLSFFDSSSVLITRPFESPYFQQPPLPPQWLRTCKFEPILKKSFGCPWARSRTFGSCKKVSICSSLRP